MDVKIKRMLQRSQLGSPRFSKGRKFSRATENAGVCDGVDFALETRDDSRLLGAILAWPLGLINEKGPY